MSEQSLSTTAGWWRAFSLRMAIGAALTLAIVAVALGPRGLAHVGQLAAATNWTPHAPRWDLVAAAPLVIKVHLATVLTAFAIGAFQMLGPKGRTMHRVVGWAYVALMLTTAVATLFIPRHGRFAVRAAAHLQRHHPDHPAAGDGGGAHPTTSAAMPGR